MEKTLNKALLNEYFSNWKDVYEKIVRKEEFERQEKIRKEKEFQKKVEAANKFRLRKILIQKHMIFKRIRRVIKAEKKCLEIMKKELSIYHKKRFLRYWKIYNGMIKIEKMRNTRMCKKIIK